MITKKKVKREVITDEIDTVTCDFCNSLFDKMTTRCKGFGQITFYFGYGSIFDDRSFTLQICDKCFIKKFSEKLKNQIEN